MPACNLCKATRTIGLDPETRSEVPLFDPRSEPWDHHFVVDPATGTILGLTAVGRSTIAGLQMNRPVQLGARLQWMRLGIFP